VLQTVTHSKQPATVFGSRKSHSRSVDADRVLIRVRLCGVNLTPRRQLKHIEMTVKSNWFLTDPEANSRSLELKSISGSEWCQAARASANLRCKNRKSPQRHSKLPASFLGGMCLFKRPRSICAASSGFVRPSIIASRSTGRRL
jgi:hypothetical protein